MEELLEKFDDCHLELNNITEKRIFEYGFKLGARIAFEVMGMEIYHQDDLIFEMEPQLHWWLTGFKLHPKVYAPSSLTMSARIDFPTEEMSTLFVENANATGEIEAERSGTHTSFVW